MASCQFVPISTHTKVRKELGTHITVSSRLHHLYQRFSKSRQKEWWDCRNYLHRLPYPTNRCKHHQNKGSGIHQLLRRRNCCHGSCFTVDFHKRRLIPDFHPHLHGQQITMWGTLIIEPLDLPHPSMYIIHFIIHLHTMGARIFQHPWQWPSRQSSERNNNNWIRYRSIHTNFMHVLGRQWIVLWQSTFARPHKWNLPLSQDFAWSTADAKPQRWCTYRLTPFWTPPIPKGLSSLDWPRNWFYMSIMSANGTHTTTLASWVPSGRCCLKWLVIRPRNVIVFTRKTLVDLDTYRQYHPVIPYIHTHTQTHTHTHAQTRIATINQKFQHALIALQTNCIP